MPGSHDAQSLPNDESEQQDINAPFGIKKNERIWVATQPHLERRGYMLRSRYHRGWVGSWVGSSKAPSDCEDSIPAAEGRLVLDAVRVLDGTQVMLKLWTGPDAEFPFELPILKYFSTEPLATNPKNHCVPLLEFFPVEVRPGVQLQNFQFMVQPLFRDWRYPPFKMVIELLSFIRQLLEGLEFMHSHNVAHRDICARNVLMDARALFPDGFHGAFNVNGDVRRREVGLRTLTRVEVPPTYYYIDFGLSAKFNSYEERQLVTWKGGVCDYLPELKADETAPYDPFKADVYALGDMLEQETNRLWFGAGFLRPLFAAMKQERPSDRPTAAECLALYEQMTRHLSRWRLLAWLRRRLWEGWWKEKEGWLSRQDEVRGYLHQLWQAVVLGMGKDF